MHSSNHYESKRDKEKELEDINDRLAFYANGIVGLKQKIALYEDAHKAVLEKKRKLENV